VFPSTNYHASLELRDVATKKNIAVMETDVNIFNRRRTWCNHGDKSTRPDSVVHVHHVRVALRGAVELGDFCNVEPGNVKIFSETKESVVNNELTFPLRWKHDEAFES